MANMGTSEGNGNRSTYVYLEFNGKIPSDVFHNQVFLRIENLDKQNPLVQINDSLFKGTYDYSIGTNLFFEQLDENINSGNAFEKQTPITLKHLHSSTKLLNLQQVKIPHSKAKIQNEIKNINYNLNWDYNELLKKFENGTLTLEDISFGEELPQTTEEAQEVEEEDNDELQCNEVCIEEPLATGVDIEYELENIIPSKKLEAQYEQLNILSRRPARRAVSPELVAQCDKKYEEAYEYHNIERQILKPRDGFNSEVLNVDEDTLSNCVDIDRCIFYGLIPPSSKFPRVLSKEEKETILTLENFDNLSFAGRYYVLQNSVNDLKACVKSTPPKKLRDKDEYGRTTPQTLEIYQKLTDAVRNRLQEIKFSLEGESCEKVNENNDIENMNVS